MVKRVTFQYIRSMAKKKVTLWVEPEYAEKLEALARLEGLAVSQYGAVLLQRGIKQANDKVGLDLLETRLKTILSQEFRKMTQALDSSLEYIGVESGTATLFLRENYQVVNGQEQQQERHVKYRSIAFKEFQKSKKKAKALEAETGGKE